MTASRHHSALTATKTPFSACLPTLLQFGFAVGLHRGLRPTRAGIAGPALLAVSGVGLLLAAIFPLREDAAGVTYDPGGHIVADVVFFLTSALGLIVLSRRLARDPRWRSLATHTPVAGAVALAGFVVAGRFVMPDDAPLHDWVGLAQRLLILLAVFPCRIARRISAGRGQDRDLVEAGGGVPVEPGPYRRQVADQAHGVRRLGRSAASSCSRSAPVRASSTASPNPAAVNMSL